MYIDIDYLTQVCMYREVVGVPAGCHYAFVGTNVIGCLHRCCRNSCGATTVIFSSDGPLEE